VRSESTASEGAAVQNPNATDDLYECLCDGVGCGWRGPRRHLRFVCGAFVCPACGLKVDIPLPPEAEEAPADEPAE